MATPVPQDLFSRFMAAVFDEKQIISVSTGFLSFFGDPANGAQTVFSPDSSDVDIDIVRGNERTSALIPRGTVSRSLGSLQKNTRSEQFSTFSRKYPLSEEEGDITGDILTKRTAGENPYSAGASRIDRLRKHGLRIHTENIRRQIRMMELLAAQSMLTGKQDAIIGTANTDLQYDFRRNSTHTITVGTSWAGGSGAIFTDIEGACGKVRANGRTMPDMMVLGKTAMNSFIKDTTVAGLADNRRFDFMAVGMNPNLAVPPRMQKFVTGGFIFQGKLRTPAGYELYLFTYLDIYDNASGTATPYIADDLVLITSSMARFDRYFGPPENLPMIPMREALYRDYFGFDPMAPPMPPNMRNAGSVIDPAMFYADAYVSSDWKKITIRTQCAPIFATTMTDAVAVLDTEP